MRFFFLVNPVSGGYKGKLLLRILEKEKSLGNIKGHVEEVSWDNLAEQLKLACTFDRIVIAGGDGTLSSVICLLSEDAPPVGVLPLGTGNDLAKETGSYEIFDISNIKNFLEFLKTASVKPLTVWEIRYGDAFSKSIQFTNYISLGLDAEIVKRFDFCRKSFVYNFIKPLGVLGNRLLYAISSLFSLFYKLRLSGLTIKADGNVLDLKFKKCLSIIFPNIKSVMGLGITNDSSDFSDNKLELVLTTNILNYLSMILRLKGPLPKPVIFPAAKSWEIHNIPPGTNFQVDGEGMPISLSGNVYISPSRQVKILVA